MIDQINSHRAENIITIEDPIEFVHPAKKVLFHKERSVKILEVLQKLLNLH